MKAVVYTRYGSLNVLQLEEVAKPKPVHDEVLIKACFETPRRSLEGHKGQRARIHCLLHLNVGHPDACSQLRDTRSLMPKLSATTARAVIRCASALAFKL